MTSCYHASTIKQPIFIAKKFNESSSSGESSDESSDEEEKPKKPNLENASLRLQEQIKQQKSSVVLKSESDARRQKAAAARQDRFTAQKSAKPCGTKIRFDSSDEDGEDTDKPKELFGSDDESEGEADFSSKIERKFRGEEGAKLFEMEQQFRERLKDDRFHVDESFIDDEIKSKVAADRLKIVKERRKREFQKRTRVIFKASVLDPLLTYQLR